MGRPLRLKFSEKNKEAGSQNDEDQIKDAGSEEDEDQGSDAQPEES